MKTIILILVSLLFISSAFAFRGGGGFRGGGVGIGVGAGGLGPRGNVAVGVGVGAGVGYGVASTRGSVYAHRSAAMSAYYHPYSTSYWGWYGYAPYHHYYYYPSSTTTVIEVTENKPVDQGVIVNEIPENCKSETIDGRNLKKCGVNWFEPQYSGTEIEYVAVEPPKQAK